MKLRHLAAAAAAVGLAAAPLAAESVRSAAPVTAASELEGNSDVFYILGAAAIVAAIVLVASEDDEPISR
ncbi:hypothetical protein WAB17_01870 [Parerythrobacter aurantius]|uniref:hypothetical protein n=1 Tax=Parerythrobacter aurantius TaxID=3127706 RepID=UPI00325453C1